LTYSKLIILLVNFPLCTIASVPRQPEHCIEWARILYWPEEAPFGQVPVDGDNPEHIMWIMSKSKVRADEYGIDSAVIDFRKTQGVVKRIIPAVASTNAIIGKFQIKIY
jgi:ubiquitin-activating enzyme E1 C